MVTPAQICASITILTVFYDIVKCYIASVQILEWLIKLLEHMHDLVRVARSDHDIIASRYRAKGDDL